MWELSRADVDDRAHCNDPDYFNAGALCTCGFEHYQPISADGGRVMHQHMDGRQLTNIIWGLACLGETYKTSGMFSLITKQIQEARRQDRA